MVVAADTIMMELYSGKSIQSMQEILINCELCLQIERKTHQNRWHGKDSLNGQLMYERYNIPSDQKSGKLTSNENIFEGTTLT